MNKSLEKILSVLKKGEDNIYTYDFKNSSQNVEVTHRSNVSEEKFDDYFEHIGHYHSVPVMVEQVKNYLKHIPKDGIVLDVGGGWGWHWSEALKERVDVKVIILDLVCPNFFHTKKILKEMIGVNVFLVHGDATELPFEAESFDGFWSVQAIQHIPNFELSLEQAMKVLKPGGIFRNYSFNDQLLHKWYYQLRGRKYVIEGNDGDVFFLRRGSARQDKVYRKVFKKEAKRFYSELFFQPDLRLAFCGQKSSFLGKVDAFFSKLRLPFVSWFARQICFEVRK